MDLRVFPGYKIKVQRKLTFYKRTMLLVLRTNYCVGQLKQVTLGCRSKICLKNPISPKKKVLFSQKKKKKLPKLFTILFHYNIYKYIDIYIFTTIRERGTLKKGEGGNNNDDNHNNNITKKILSQRRQQIIYKKDNTNIYILQGGRSRVLINKSTKKQ